MTALIASDLEIAARTIFGEARGQPYAGQKAVAHVIINRWKRNGVDGTIASTCLRWKQFSCWNPGDPTRAKMTDATWDDARLREALRAFLEAMDEEDFTGGARWYHTVVVSPSWSRGKQPVLTIGDHAFFNDID